MDNHSESQRWWDLPAAALLGVALIVAATRLVITQWTPNLSVVQSVAFLGLIAGLALGQSRFSARLAGLFAVAYGAHIVPWQLGLTMSGGIAWAERLNSLLGRLEVIINQLLAREVVQDSLLFITLMSVLFWALSVYAGYTLTRTGSAWRAVLPPGLAIFVIHSFDSLITRKAWYLAIYLFFALVLVARMAFLDKRAAWQHRRTALPPYLGVDFIRFAMLAAGVLVVFAWTAPALANTLPAAEKVFQRVKEPWNDLRDRWDNAFASLRTTVGVVSDYYGSSVLLGRGNRLTDAQVFSVATPADTPAAVRFYWRARVYDTYSENQWLSASPTSRTFNPESDALPLPEDDGRWAGTFEVAANTYISTVFSPAQPLWFSRPAQAEIAANPDGSFDLSAFRATPSLTPGEVYQVQAVVANASQTQLRAAGNRYPEWVTQRYLQLPAGITDRTRELAAEITRNAATPYDKAVAVTNWLRSNIEYTETIPARPLDQESVDWFLFDLKQGFCNYYATAQVVLLRSVGIPARWAVGYAQGEESEDGRYIVRQRDAHAWPEVFFPGYGWIEFEPTASQPTITRVLGSPSDVTDDDPATREREVVNADEIEREMRLDREEARDLMAPGAAGEGPGIGRVVLTWGAPAAAGLLLAGLAFRNRRRINFEKTPIVLERTLLRLGIRPPAFLHRWALLAGLPPLSRAYLEINRALKRAGRGPQDNDTPAERAAALGQAIPPAHAPAQTLVAEYQLATFSPQPADEQAARQAGAEIRRLSLRKWVRDLLARFQRK